MDTLKIKYLNIPILLILLILNACSPVPKEFLPFQIDRLSLKEFHELVLKHKNELLELDESYKKKHITNLFLALNQKYIDTWAPPEMMKEWYEILLSNLMRSKDPINLKSARLIADDALILAIYLKDKSFAKKLPAPWFADKYRDYFINTPEVEFYGKKTLDLIKPYTLSNTREVSEMFCQLLAAVAKANEDYETALDAYKTIESRSSPDQKIFPVTDIAWCVNQTGKVDKESQKILLAEYARIQSNPSRMHKRRQNYISQTVQKLCLPSNKSIPESSSDSIPLKVSDE